MCFPVMLCCLRIDIFNTSINTKGIHPLFMEQAIDTQNTILKEPDFSVGKTENTLGLVRCYLELSYPTATLLSCHTQCLFVFYTIFLMTFTRDFLWYCTCIYFQICFVYYDVYVYMCHSAIAVVRKNLLGTGPLSLLCIWRIELRSSACAASTNI